MMASVSLNLRLVSKVARDEFEVVRAPSSLIMVVGVYKIEVCLLGQLQVFVGLHNDAHALLLAQVAQHAQVALPLLVPQLLQHQHAAQGTAGTSVGHQEISSCFGKRWQGKHAHLLSDEPHQPLRWQEFASIGRKFECFLQIMPDSRYASGHLKACGWTHTRHFA
jgi:hypothetical protein